MASWDTLQLSCRLSTEGIFPENPVLPVFGCRVKHGVNGAEPSSIPIIPNPSWQLPKESLQAKIISKIETQKMIKKWNMMEQLCSTWWLKSEHVLSPPSWENIQELKAAIHSIYLWNVYQQIHAHVYLQRERGERGSYNKKSLILPPNLAHKWNAYSHSPWWSWATSLEFWLDGQNGTL